MLSVRPSTSIADNVPVIVESSAPMPEVSPEITARSSTGVIVSEISWVVVPSWSSVTVTVKESTPK